MNNNLKFTVTFKPEFLRKLNAEIEEGASVAKEAPEKKEKKKKAVSTALGEDKKKEKKAKVPKETTSKKTKKGVTSDGSGAAAELECFEEPAKMRDRAQTVD